MEHYFQKLVELNEVFIDQNHTIIDLLRTIAGNPSKPVLPKKEWESTSQPREKPSGSYTDEELVTVKVAQGKLGVSRWKIYDMRIKEQLTTVERDGQVRLIRAEVEAARLWYSVPKGKV